MEEIISKMSEGYGVLCKTEQAAKALLSALSNHGFTWKDGGYLTDENHWGTFEDTTVLCQQQKKPEGRSWNVAYKVVKIR